jgi:hypothetical protein
MRVNNRSVVQSGWFIIVCSILMSLGSSAHAGTIIGVSQSPPPPMGPFVSDDNNNDMIMVGSESGPIPIAPDPSTTTPWMKQFVINRDGQGWSPTGPLSMVNVMEWITFPPTTAPFPIVDWHEDIVVDPTAPDGATFKWAGGTITTPLGTFPGTTSTDGKSIWFDFPPMPPGIPFKISKDLMWTGGVITPGQNGTNNYIIKINERPSTPEPSSAMLVALALVSAAGPLRRR